MRRTLEQLYFAGETLESLERARADLGSRQREFAVSEKMAGRWIEQMADIGYEIALIQGYIVERRA